MLAERWDDCIEIARDQIRDGAHLLDLCVDYVGRDGAADMRELAGRLATASTLPIVLDSTEPDVLRAGLEMLGGRALINSVNYEDGDGPESRINRIMPMVVEHGAGVVALTIDEEGQARTADWKVQVADRLIRDLTGQVGDERRRHPRRHAHVPDRHRPGGDPTRRHRDHRGHHAAQDAATRRSRRPSACPTSPSASTRQRDRSSTPSSCTSASPRGSTPPSCTRPRSCRCRRSPTSSGTLPSTSSTTGVATTTTATTTYDPLQRFLELFEGVEARSLQRVEGRGAGDAAAVRAARAAHRRRRAAGPRGGSRRGARATARHSRSSTTRCSPA